MKLMFLMGAALLVVLTFGVMTLQFRDGGARPPAKEATAAAIAGGDGVAPSPVDTRSLTRVVAGLEAQISSLQSQLAATNARLDAAGGKEGHAADVVAAETQHPDPDMRAELGRRHAQYVASLDAAFRSERSDPHWSSGTTQAVKQALGHDEAMQGVARSLECRSRMCRLEVSDDGSNRVRGGLQMLALRLASTLPNIAVGEREDEHGGPTTVLYMAATSEALQPPPAE